MRAVLWMGLASRGKSLPKLNEDRQQLTRRLIGCQTELNDGVTKPDFIAVAHGNIALDWR
jgi:hypothetical protein